MTEEKKGVFQERAKTVEELRETFPWFRIEDSRADVVRFGNEFAHPTYAEAMSLDVSAMQAGNQDPSKDNEQLRQERQMFTDYQHGEFERIKGEHPEFDEYGYWLEADIESLCPEEPDAPALHVLMRRYTGGEGPYPTIIMAPTGGLFLSIPWMMGNAPITKYFGCQLVIPQIRTYPDAEYPAAMNDMQTAYQWMVDNAEELEVDTDRILLLGWSSGAGIAAALPFRLKRYDWCGAPRPRGVVAYDGFFDDRETTRSMRMMDKGWSGLANRGANMRYMGKNFASGFIGPEAFANHATVAECEGLPPYAIFEHQDCPGCDPAIQFMKKLNDAGIYCSFMMQAGCTHTSPLEAAERISMFNLRESDYEPTRGIDAISREESFITGSIHDFLDFDLRR